MEPHKKMIALLCSVKRTISLNLPFVLIPWQLGFSKTARDVVHWLRRAQDLDQCLHGRKTGRMLGGTVQVNDDN